jgi:preprotein translocase subunit SecE
MLKLKLYLQEVYDEMSDKVTWPSWNELQSSAIVVSIASVIIALIVYSMDKVFSELLKVLYNIF